MADDPPSVSKADPANVSASDRASRPRPSPLIDAGAIFIERNIRERRFPVTPPFDGCRLDRFLAERLARLTRSKARRIARHGDVRLLPERRVKPAARVRAGDTVVLREHLEPEWVQDHEVSILWRRRDLLALNKPAGMLTHESAGVRLNTATAYLERAGLDAEPVHRLDRETSGVLLCARGAEAVARARSLFATDRPDKVYRALVLDPNFVWRPGDEATINDPLGPVDDSPLRVRMGPGTLAARFGRLVDLEVRIETGRQHQIRAHLAMQGTPVAGDKLYGQSDAFFRLACDNPWHRSVTEALPFARHALHAWRLSFELEGGKVRIEAPLPGAIWPLSSAERS